MEVKQVQHEEVGDSPDFRKTRCDEVGVEVPFFKVIESGYQPIRNEEHQPEDEAVEAAAAAPEGFILVVREDYRQGHDENQCDEADVCLCEFRLQDAPLQILLQLRGESTTIPAFIRKKIENPQQQKKDAVNEGRNPVELEAEL